MSNIDATHMPGTTVTLTEREQRLLREFEREGVTVLRSPLSNAHPAPAPGPSESPQR